MSELRGQTVNQHYYIEVLKRLHEKNRKKKKIRILESDVPVHTAISIKQFLPSKNISELGHPPYSTDLSPCDFFIFPTVKSCLKATHFTSVEEIKAKKGNLLKDLVPGLLPAMAAPNDEVCEC
ncbi:uncharacterized protein TNCV_3938061 [Trichonephila clavipes]|nr:uncharacterized protein TNCV_3938061 [Trichonephila clavipes]